MTDRGSAEGSDGATDQDGDSNAESGTLRDGDANADRDGNHDGDETAESDAGDSRDTNAESGPGPDGRPDLADRRGVERVYQPAEDSVLLADVVVDRVAPDDRLLDVGSGSGYVAARAAETGATVVGSDLNPHACRQTLEAGVPAVRTNLTATFREGAFDVVAFNPPYLPTEPADEWGDWMESALSGGEDGRAAIEPFLDDVGRVLAPDGAAFLLVSTLTDPGAVRASADANGLNATEVTSESYPFEQLLVLRLRKTGD